MFRIRRTVFNLPSNTDLQMTTRGFENGKIENAVVPSCFDHDVKTYKMLSQDVSSRTGNQNYSGPGDSACCRVLISRRVVFANSV